MFLTRQLLFLLDTGATNSIIKETELTKPIPLSGKTISSRSATGHVVIEPFSTPLECSIDEKKFEHCFLITQTCPVNLMGRELLGKLGVSVHCTSEGLFADMRMLHVATGETPLFVYEWQVSNTCLTTKAHDRVLPSSEFMNDTDLHCTSHVSTGPDDEYAQRWFNVDVEDVKTDYLYWTNHWCVLDVKLTDKQAMFYDVENAQPHISLAKPVKAEWRDAGPFMAKCHELTDWVIIDRKRMICQSESTGWFKQPCHKTLRGLRAVTVLEEEMTSGSLTLLHLPVIPEGLEGVPNCLWAKDKYD